MTARDPNPVWRAQRVFFPRFAEIFSVLFPAELGDDGVPSALLARLSSLGSRGDSARRPALVFSTPCSFSLGSALPVVVVFAVARRWARRMPSLPSHLVALRPALVSFFCLH